MSTDPHLILYTKAPHLTRDFVDKLSTREAWQMVYALPRGKPRPKPKNPVCFTGFAGTEHEPLAKLAQERGFMVVGSVTKNLAILVTGLTPGPKKIETARQQQDTRIMTAEEFLAYCNSLPSKSELPA